MNAYLNYVVEANIALMMFLLCYRVLLNKETDFRLLRAVLITGVMVSITFPLIHVDGAPGNSPLSLGRVVPTYWLPEVVISGTNGQQTSTAPFDFWSYVSVGYWTGVVIAGILLLMRILQLADIIRRSRTYRMNNLRIAESNEDQSTFSFFRFILIGRAHELSANEKQQVIRHESVHAQQWHSFDILLINFLNIFFWFNPFIITYKKIFIQLHEFEADARAVENSDMNKYCNLLAKVALRSAGLNLANHFSNSLTVKRIEMMRTRKSNIKQWKLVAMTSMLPLIFFFIACQDQVGDDVMEIAKNSTYALEVPQHIQARYEQLKKDNPGKTYAVLELNEKASEKLDGLKTQYGLPKSMEVFETMNGKPVPGETTFEPAIKGESSAGVVINRKTNGPVMQLEENSGLKIRQARRREEGRQTFAIFEFNEEVSKLAEASQEDRIYTVVEEQPEFPGGYDSMMVFIKENLRYPTESRMKGIEGTVYVSFIVGKDGTVSEAKVIRGIDPQADVEAQRVVSLSPPWIPGKQKNEAVSVRFVLPIKFKLQQ